VPCIGHRQRIGAFRHEVARKDRRAVALQRLDIEAEFFRKRFVQLDQPRLGGLRGRLARKELLWQPRIAVVEGEGPRRGCILSKGHML